MLRPCSQGWPYFCYVRAGSWDLGLQWALLPISQCIWLPVSVAWYKPRQNGEWTNHLGSLLLMLSWQWCRCEYCHNILLRVFWLNPVTKLLPRPKQDYTNRVMLNVCVRAHWSPMCHYWAHTLLRDSHLCLQGTVISHYLKALDTDRRLFHPSVSVFRFPYFSIFYLPCLIVTVTACRCGT